MSKVLSFFYQIIARAIDCLMDVIKTNELNNRIADNNEILDRNNFQFNKSNDYQCEENIVKSRIIITIISFSIIFLFLIIKLCVIAQDENSHVNNYSVKCNKFRKEIVDRNGKILAVNLPSSSLYANPKKAVNIEQSLDLLGNIIPNLDKKNIKLDIKNNKTFVWIKRDITKEQQESIAKLGLPGFFFEKEQKRLYPYGNLLAHVVGYVGRDLEGFAGIERSFNDLLLTPVKLGNKNSDEALKLSIDVRLQNIVNEEIQFAVDKFKANGAVGILVNPNNGEILAMVCKKDFDPHNPGQASPDTLFNRASLSVNEIGSVFKALTIAIALDTGVATLNDAYDITHMQVDKFQIKDFTPRKGYHSVPEIFLYSSNIGVGQMILEVGENNYKKYLKQLGMLDTLKTELLERATPLYPQEKHWSDISLVTMSYGYGLSVSPLHFVQAMVPVVNGGNFYPLTFLKKSEDQSLVSRRVFKEETSKHLLKLMRLSVAQGTSKKADLEGFLVGGKTGTANKACSKGYSLDKRVSSFLGVLPAHNPQFLIYVMIDEPKPAADTLGMATGGWTAAPVVNKIFSRLAALYGMEPIDPNDIQVQELLDLQYKVQNET